MEECLMGKRAVGVSDKEKKIKRKEVGGES